MLTRHYSSPARRNTPVLLLAATIALLATACGGGGSGNSASETPPPPPIVPPPTQPPAELYRISGVVTASASQAVDGDTNDPAGEVRPNDSVASAQAIANPITLGGYVNQPGSGAPGRSQAAGDTDDYFRVELLAGQSVTMLVADYRLADADLYLWDTEGNILDYSIEIGEVESLVVPRDGTYVVNAFAAEGATNYILAIGNRNEVAGQSQRHFDIVPWQTVIKFREGTDSAVATNDPDVGPAGRMGLKQRAGGRGRARLMALQQVLAGGPELAARSGTARDKREAIRDPALRARWETLTTIKTLRRDPQIEYAEPNYQVRALGTPNDEGYRFQWHYPLINLPAAWDTTTGDANVIVAVVDTGILSAHPDLRGQWIPGYDFVRDPASAGDGDGIDPDPEETGDAQGTASSSFHGTHVSGTVAAAGNNGLGVAGVAYSAKIMPLRALGAGGGGTSYDVDQAIRFAAGLPNDSGAIPVQRADIINLSLGGARYSQSSQDLYRQVRAAGIAIVAAAGNEATTLPSYPAAYDGVISVSAVDAQRRLTSYSNTGSSIDLAAPGGNNSVDLNGDGYPDGILSTGAQVSDGAASFAYTFISGTSMASPHVAGVLALMKSVNPDLTPEDIDSLIIRGSLSDDLGAPGRDDAYGHGLINAQRAVLAALQSGDTPPADAPRLSASSSSLNFASTGETLELELRNDGKGPLQLLELSASETWLTLAAENTDDDGLGLYRLTVNRDGLPGGVYAADITAKSSVNTLTVRVIMSVGGDSSTADVGVIYILLYDMASEEVLAEARVAAEDGRYPFEFVDTPPGQYQIFAGSDADNDLFVCDAGEACGAWLTVDRPITIDLVADRDDLNFPVDYLVSIPNITGTGQPGAGNARPIPLPEPAKRRSK